MADQQVITITELAQLLIERADNKRIVVAVAGAPGSGKSFIIFTFPLSRIKLPDFVLAVS